MIIGLVTALALPELALTDRILARGDTFGYFYPYWDARNLALQAGHLPLWTSDLFMGAPLLANPQLGTFYLPNWLVMGLTAPDAIRVSVLMHVFWAGAGAYLLAKRILGMSSVALVAGLIYMLGGVIGGHVEQINQLQGLAWLPWLMLFYHLFLNEQRGWRWLIFMSLAWALQIFSGHTQTTFITGGGLGLYGLMVSLGANRKLPTLMKTLLGLGISTGWALVLALPQLVPTLELTSLSNRSDFDVQAVTAFSLAPTYLPRALLPSYDGQLFTEYLGYVGIISLGLALLGAFIRQTDSKRWPWIVLASLGLLLAMGRFNPAYWLLAELPGFNLFRVPARWLVLFNLGTAILAGFGLRALLNGHRPKQVTLSLVLLIISSLMLAARFLSGVGIDPQDMVGPVVPTSVTMLGWVLAIIGLLIVIYLAARTHRFRWAPGLIVGMVTLELVVAGHMMPYHDLAPRDVYLSPSFTTLQMRVFNEDEIVPSRVLPVSLLNFDPGNRDALAQRYAAYGMYDNAIFTAFVALKKQEMLFPNLPLKWGIPSVDGFGGGVLPMRSYTFFSRLLLPDVALTDAIDGRLSERLAEDTCRGLCVPDARYLQMADIGYLIADKPFDLPFDDIFYDTSLSQPWRAMSMRVNPTFQATYVHLLVDADTETPDSSLHVFSQDEQFTLALDESNRSDYEPFSVIEIALPEPTTITQVVIDDVADDLTLYAVTLVDARTGDFWQVPLDGWLRVLSSDIKIYERENPLGRAYIVPHAEILPDTTEGDFAAIERMMQDDFDPAQTVILHVDENLPDERIFSGGTADITLYEDTRVEITTNTGSGGYLVLSDAYYPDWQATIDGEVVPIMRANSTFKAIMLPAGEHVVVFEFVPSWTWALVVGAIGWVASLIVLIFSCRTANPPVQSPD